MNVDPLASLRMSPIVLTVGDRDLTIPPVPAADWFAAVLGTGWLPILSLLPADDQEYIDDLLAEGAVDLDELIGVSQDALEIASGWQWWAAERLMVSAGAEWQIVSGQLARRGIDLWRLPLGAVLNAVMAMSTETLKDDERLRFELELTKPPPGLDEDERERIAEEMMAAAMQEALRPS